MSTPHDPTPPQSDLTGTDAYARRGPEPGVLYTIIGLLVALLLLAVYMLGRQSDDDDLSVVLETASPTPTPTQSEVVLVPESESEEAPEPVATSTDPVVPPSDPETEPADQTSDPDPTPSPTEPPPIPEATADEQAEQPEDPGELVAEDGRSMFPVDDDDVDTFVGQQMLGSQVLIESVVEGVGFWVGNGPDNRVFVRYEGSLLGFTPVKGERIDFSAPMEANPDGLEVPDGQGGEQLRRQGASIALDQGV